jgi:lipopolysaccharide transport protein LptA
VKLVLLLLAAADAGLLARPVQVTADHLELLNAEGRAVYTGHAHAIRDGTEVECDTLTAHYDKGQQVRSIDALGNVFAHQGEKQAWGETGHFDNDTGRLEVLGHPKVQSGTKQVVGERVVFEQGSDRLDVDQPRTLTQQGKESVEIEADHLVLFDKVETATWTGQPVKATKGVTRLFAPNLKARYDEKGEVKHLEGWGGVHVIDKDREAWGAALDYDLDHGVVVVTGNPRARDGQKRIAGSRVKFLTAEDRIVVDDAKTVFQNEEQKK